MQKTYPAINIQWPISELILSGEKTIETRTYAIPQKYLNVELLLVETPGKTGKFKARITGIITFDRQIEYKTKTSFSKDQNLHKVDENSPWAWTPEKKKWGWVIKQVIKFPTPLPAPANRGIAFTKQIKINLPKIT